MSPDEKGGGADQGDEQPARRRDAGARARRRLPRGHGRRGGRSGRGRGRGPRRRRPRRGDVDDEDLEEDDHDEEDDEDLDRARGRARAGRLGGDPGVGWTRGRRGRGGGGEDRRGLNRGAGQAGAFLHHLELREGQPLGRTQDHLGLQGRSQARPLPDVAAVSHRLPGDRRFDRRRHLGEPDPLSLGHRQCPQARQHPERGAAVPEDPRAAARRRSSSSDRTSETRRSAASSASPTRPCCFASTRTGTRSPCSPCRGT